MIEFEEARELILENTGRLGAEERLIEAAVGCVLAEAVVAPIQVSPFRNSAMDGFAVKADWLKDCSAASPKVMPVGATLFAGDPGSVRHAERRAPKVMTGAPVPAEYDAVVPFENTEYNDNEVRFLEPVASGANVRPAGEDIALGQELYSRGAALGRLDIGILATIGLRSVPTYRKPLILTLGTGDELVNPGEELGEAKIYDSNTFTVQSLVAPFCDSVERVCGVRDREEEIEKALSSSHDVIVTSGGVSAGERDLIVDMAEAAGWKRIFHKVRIKPGKPIYFATRGRQLLFGLPGNPLSTAVTCAVFLIPALKKMIGYADYRLGLEPATLAPGEVRKSRRKLIWPGLIKHDGGRTVVRFSPKKSSAALTALLGTDGLIIQSAAETSRSAVTVQAIRWDRLLNQ